MTEITNQQVIIRYLERYSHSKISQSTRKYALEYFFKSTYFGFSRHIFTITKRDIIDYFDYLNHLETIALQTKQNKWMVFIGFVNFINLYYDNFSINIPGHCINWSPVHKKPNSNKDVILSIEELKRILDFHFQYSYHYYVILRLLAETGMRIGEFLSINHDSIDLNKRLVETEGKTGRKIYYFSEDLVKHLKLYLKDRSLKGAKTKALFISNQNRRISGRIINRQLRECTQKIDIQKWITCHTFRKTLNTLRKKMGCPKEDRKILLCHKSRDVNFQCYVIYNYDDFIQLFDRWNPFKSVFEN
ncbi:MAG: tyrosine-type recombinase/integrase [Promethearchaeota archaeon]